MLARSLGNTSVLELALGKKFCQTNSIDKLFRAEDLDNFKKIKIEEIVFGLIIYLKGRAAPKAITSICLLVRPATKAAGLVLPL